MEFKGSIVAIVTPFTEHGVDEYALHNLIEFQIKNGSQGIVPCGTTGESPTLSHEEHDHVIEIAVEEVRWSTRGSNMNEGTATSLDQVEGLIREKTELRVVSVQIAECSRTRCKCHIHARACGGDRETAIKMAAEHVKTYGPSGDFDYLLK